MSSYVWVQLYYKGKHEPEGTIFIKTASLDPPVIAALAEAVKDKMAEELTHCSSAKLVVFPPKSSGDREKQYGPDKEMKEVIAELEKKKTPPTSGKHPLIVVAPDPNQQPANAEPPQPGLSEEVIAKIENSVCVLVEDGKNFGSGFAVSSKRVLIAAHHWEEGDDEDATRFAVAVGDQVQCIHGKPSDNRRYNLQVVKLDQHLDYCILELIGDSTLSEWLETDVSPNLRLTTPVFLASYQIGIQQHLETYNMGVSLGIANGIIMRRSDRHMVHSCSAFKGDSGGAIVISNGKVIGLHVASVNEAKQLLDVNEIDLGSVAESINQLCDAQSSGSIALLMSAIES